MNRAAARPLHPRRFAAGLSLIELLVSIAIGLILMVAIVSAYLGSATASKMAEAQGRMNEDAQAALAILTQHLRMAGNNPKQPNYAAPTKNPAFLASSYQIRGCDGTFSNIGAAADLASLTCVAGATDSIAVAYEADIYNTIKTAAVPARPADCLGQALPAVAAVVSQWDGNPVVPPAPPVVTPTNVSYELADNRFYVSSALGAPNLYCKGNGGGTAQPLVENIENIQVTYGVAHPTNGTVAVLGYLSASEMDADPTLATIPGAPAVAEEGRWSKVMSVRVCVVARSELPVVSDAASAKYYDCAGALVDAPDLRLRRAYSTTVILRNRVSPS